MKVTSVLLKTIIVIIILIIVIIGIMLMVLNKDNEIKEQELIEENNKEDVVENQNYELTQIKEEAQYYNGLHYVQKYLNSIYYEELEQLISITYVDYEKYKNLEKVKDYINGEITELKDTKFYAKKGYYKDFDENHSIYMYEGKIIKNESIENICFGALIDYENMAYAIINGKSAKEIDKLDIQKNVEKDNFNSYEYYYEQEENISRQILDNYKFNIKYNQEEIYNNLNEEYRQKRFNDDIQKYYLYVNNIKSKVENSVLSKYNTEYINDEKKYIIEDNYGNQYVYLQTDISDYTIMLDNYTILDEKYMQKYNSLKDESKVHTNIDMFIKMINTKDYEHAYEKLDDTFKTNNFGNVENFKAYMKSNFYDNNLLTVDDVEQKNDVYLVNVTLSSNSSSVAEKMQKNFVVKLGEGTNFTMSFNLN